MDRFNELERLWETRQKKRKIAYASIFALVLAAFALYLFLPGTPAKMPQVKTVAAEPALVKAPAPQPKPLPQAKPLPPKPEPAVQTPRTVPPQKERLKDPLSITLDRSFESQVAAAVEACRETRTATETETVETEPKDEIQTALPDSLTIKSETVDDSEKINLLIDNYEFDPTYDNAMKIARHYFATQTYREAVTWSLEANKRNSADDESWLIFAKASVALGESEQAIKALRTYLLKRDSLRIRQLLDEIGNRP
jgi:outer membrane biosynthesis protein TonB